MNNLVKVALDQVIMNVEDIQQYYSNSISKEFKDNMERKAMNSIEALKSAIKAL
jgi:hypothetical protein